jgi:hypothetical protein
MESIQECGLRDSVRMNELPDNFDGHRSDMGTAITCQQLHCAWQHLHLVRAANPLVASITSQRMQGRYADALVSVVQHVKQIAEALGFEVVIKKSAAMIADIGTAVMKSFA